MNIYEFMSDSPWLTFFLIFFVFIIIGSIWKDF